MFKIIETPGRMQPFAVWRDGKIWQFCATRDEAELYIKRSRIL